eukprot:m.36101 g.36101  ORF g.36101 m.36101 type:complete len:738 (+) comp9967_c0_seq1:168-2381(+)
MSRKDTFNLSDLSKLSQDDRIAAMRMVAEGEMTIDDAIARLKLQTDRGAGVVQTITKGFARRGAFRQNRGRLRLEIRVHAASAFTVLVLHVHEGRDLLAMNKNNTANPQLRAWLTPDEKGTKKKTQVRKNTVNPMFNEQFTWEIRTGSDIENRQLKIVVGEHSKLRRSQFMGSMTFPLAELFEEKVKEGWFRLLDQKKGDFQFIPFRAKVKDDSQVSVRKQAQATRGPLPPVPTHAPAEPPVSRPSAPPRASVSASSAVAPRPSSRPSSRTATATKKVELGKVTSESFNFLMVLGQGSFGKVLMAEHHGTKEVFAVKVLKKEVVVEDDDVECTMIERRVLALSGGCPFLTNLVATFQTPEHLYFVMEFVTGGDLMFHIQKLRRFSQEQTAFYAGEILLGLWYLHKNGVLYRDLKLDNVMLAGDGHIKIADFGMCKENIWGAATTTTFCGTPGYLAPEIINELPYGASVDFWSLGVLIYEMLVGDSPFEGDDEDELFDQILHHEVQFPARISSEARSFLNGLLTRPVRSRLGCGRNGEQDIKAHPFFAGTDWTKLENRQIDPPYKPPVKDPRSADCFDPEFTEADTRLSPTDPYAIANIDQTVFREFSFVNKTFFGEQEQAEEEDASTRRPALFEYNWYRPDLPREEAARCLRGTPVGTFFVRESSSQPGCYAIAMVSEGNKIWNGLVTPSVTGDGSTLYKLFVKQKFRSLPDLIEYYYSHPVTTAPSGKKLCLLAPQ